jgi:type II secretory pathway pseudopilin PulG
VLAFVLVAVLIFALLGTALLTVTYGVRARAIRFKNETIAMLAAEAGYEQALFWMGEQSDVLNGLAASPSAGAGTLTFTSSSATYLVTFENYMGARPIFRVLSVGTCGSAKRVVDCFVMQAIDGWAMAKCRIPNGTTSDKEVYFATGETIDMPLCINKLNDSPDVMDIYIDGTPKFTQKVSMGELQRAGNVDKYSGVMNLFQGGIIFGQPKLRITDPTAVSQKIARFKNFTKPQYIFTPQAVTGLNKGVTNTDYLASGVYPAVQLEFYVQGGVGYVRITNNCTVICGQRSGATNDYCIPDPANPNTYGKYDIYGWHYRYDPCDAATPVGSKAVPALVTDTYVQQVFSGKASDPGGQIYVNGNVVIGGDTESGVTLDTQVLQGKLTVVATGNIWIADSIMMDGTRYPNSDPCNPGMPAANNPNVLGLIAGGVVKVIDPGMSSYARDDNNGRPGPPQSPRTLAVGSNTFKFRYAPVANQATGSVIPGDRTLPNPMIIEAAVTVGGGGWGAEGVSIANNGETDGRRESGEPSGSDGHTQDSLILRGSICEVVRGVVGIIDHDGYLKQYYLDDRLLEGVLPGNIWFGGKYIPAPAGWHDYRQ